MLGRLQFLEGQSRYENILKDYPPTDVYVYVDRISCDKNGTEKMGAVQAYAWFYWDLENPVAKALVQEKTISYISGELYINGVPYNKSPEATKIHWIRRSDKKK
jgi:hypothetical protein